MRTRFVVRRRLLGLALLVLLVLLGCFALQTAAVATVVTREQAAPAHQPPATDVHGLPGALSDAHVLSTGHSIDRVTMRRGSTPVIGSFAAALLVTLVVVGLAVGDLRSRRAAGRHELLSRGPPRSMRLI